MAEPFRGTYTVLITPFTADGAAVDLKALERLVEFQIAEGIQGLIPLGSTGEFLSVSREERTAITETVVRVARECAGRTGAGRVPVLMGTGAEDTREVVALSKEAEALGADGVMIIPPYYSVPTEDELFHHYKTVADAIGIPIMVYNNPATANVDLLPATLARLSTIPNCRYVKESTLEVTRVRDIVALCGDRMEVFAGVLGYESAWLGAVGWVAVCSNVAPRLSTEMFAAAAFEADREKSLALYRRLAPLLPWVGGPRYVSGTKAAFRLMGMDMGAPRPPRLPLLERDVPALARVLQEMGVTIAARAAAE
ncbi:dihydrodipicolinate synthase family protein [Paeniroseomonas aquatica]|uniref:4-hydroxy-tetrahydrodipicolinate synthase n=1 Tax=Paeniroseomonas aquatica TaxID=373043 RepID=A0ABT8A4Q5_9PROT|nr:dihydrodipicolinate synthase family protein [Paeniroseomonas aquatica]MDN3564554.1 dihydrodipicolinate synthase family protein [Paeniroseomonas aquatica]